MTDNEIIQEIDKAMKLGRHCAFREVIIMIQDMLLQQAIPTRARAELLMLKHNIEKYLEDKDHGKE